MECPMLTQAQTGGVHQALRGRFSRRPARFPALPNASGASEVDGTGFRSVKSCQGIQVRRTQRMPSAHAGYWPTADPNEGSSVAWATVVPSFSHCSYGSNGPAHGMLPAFSHVIRDKAGPRSKRISRFHIPEFQKLGLSGSIRRPGCNKSLQSVGFA